MSLIGASTLSNTYVVEEGGTTEPYRFDYKTMAWVDLPIADDHELMSLVSTENETVETDTLSPAG